MRQRGYALVVEGYRRTSWLWPSMVSKTPLPPWHCLHGRACAKLFRFTDSVVFSFDGDAAGRRAAGRALEAALPHATEQRTIRFLFLPTEHDPDSYVRDLGAEAFERAVEAALLLSRQLLQVSSEGCDLAGPEGRARMLATARPLWSLLPDDGLLKRQILGELARAAQLPEEELRALWSGQPTRPDGARPPAADSARRPGRAAPLQRAAARAALAASPAKAADHAVRLLLQHNELWADLEPGRPPPAARPARASRPADRLVGAAFAAPRAQRLGDHRCRLARRRIRRHAGTAAAPAAGVVEETQPQADLQARCGCCGWRKSRPKPRPCSPADCRATPTGAATRSCCNEPPSCEATAAPEAPDGTKQAIMPLFRARQQRVTAEQCRPRPPSDTGHQSGMKGHPSATCTPNDHASLVRATPRHRS